jgi:hypothetical protein
MSGDSVSQTPEVKRDPHIMYWKKRIGELAILLNFKNDVLPSSEVTRVAADNTSQKALIQKWQKATQYGAFWRVQRKQKKWDFFSKVPEKEFSRWSVRVGSWSSTHANRSKTAQANSLVQIDNKKIIVKYSLCVWPIYY